VVKDMHENHASQMCQISLTRASSLYVSQHEMPASIVTTLKETVKKEIAS
jgi:hypothetical protein